MEKAVARLDPNTADARSGLYDQVRQTLNRRIETVEPRLTRDEVYLEVEALEDAIRKIDKQLNENKARSLFEESEARPEAATKSRFRALLPSTLSWRLMAGAGLLILAIITGFFTLGHYLLMPSSSLSAEGAPQKQQIKCYIVNTSLVCQ